MKEWFDDIRDFIIGLVLIPVLLGYAVIDYVLKATGRKRQGDD
jgi:hypothetical protein